LRDLVLDASVVAEWYHAEGERHVEAAERLRIEYQGGDLHVAVPTLLFIELVNLAGRRWRFAESDLLDLSHALNELRFTVQQPDLVAVARWTARGLTAYAASYIALAEVRRTVVVTADQQMLSIGGALAVALG
jgi:predicted nucleic acid-binding protein